MKRISQRDIAKMLKVNVSTVSRALNGAAGVSPALRDQIIALARENDYRPNPFAMSLRYDFTRIIGIIVPDVSFSHYAHIIKRIEAEARDNGYMCIITDSGDTQQGEVRCIELLENMHVEGIIMCLSQETSDLSHLERLKEVRIPLVLFDRVADCDFPSVTTNDSEAAYEATLHLIDSGARRIAFLGGPNLMKQTQDRKHGYLEALRERSITIDKELVKCHSLAYNSGYSDTTRLLAMTEPPDAILATHGLLAISAFQAIIDKRQRMPNDIALIGFMSEWVAGLSSPPMTYVRQDIKELAHLSLNLLLKQIEGFPEVKHLIVKAKLVERDTTQNF